MLRPDTSSKEKQMIVKRFNMLAFLKKIGGGMVITLFSFSAFSNPLAFFYRVNDGGWHSTPNSACSTFISLHAYTFDHIYLGNLQDSGSLSYYQNGYCYFQMPNRDWVDRELIWYNNFTETNTPTPTATPTATNTATPTATNTATPTPINTAIPTDIGKNIAGLCGTNASGFSTNTDNPINFGLGNKHYSEVDFSGKGNFPLSFTRHYNNIAPIQNTGIASWRYSYEQSLVITANTIKAIRESGNRYTFTQISGVRTT